MFNVYDKIKGNPDFYRQLRCGDSLVTLFHCLPKDESEDAWSHFNYFVYLVEGRKVWRTANGSYDLKKGDCVFVRKGACIVEHYQDADTCFMFFFMPDNFIYEALKDKIKPITKEDKVAGPVISVKQNEMVEAFFHSMIPYFGSTHQTDEALVELKFKELLFTLAGNEANHELRSYFSSLSQQPQAMSLQHIMEENFCFNLKLEEFAKLSARSLSAFKRDFENVYQTSPGKWLLEKRLHHASHLLTNKSKSVSEAAFESGFESASHFSRVFRQRFGASPVELRLQKVF